MRNILTVDVEDYFMVSAFADMVKFEDWHRYESRIEKNTLKVLDLLDGYGVKATFFTLGWIAEHHPKVVIEIQHRGHELACHGYNHRLIYNLCPDEFRRDLRKSKQLIEDITGEPVKGFRAASYSITKKSLWALDILAEEGFAYDSSIFPIYHDIYGYPEFNRFSVKVSNNRGESILEIPLSTVRVFGRNIPIAGGGYLRFAPVRLVEWAINSLNKKEAQPAVIYFHPWEVDPEQPKLNGGRISSFRHYTNIAKTIPKLRRLLNNFQFGPIKQVFADKLTISASYQ